MAIIPYSLEECKEFYKVAKEQYTNALINQKYEIAGRSVERASLKNIKISMDYWAMCIKNLEAGIDTEPMINMFGAITNPVPKKIKNRRVQVDN